MNLIRKKIVLNIILYFSLFAIMFAYYVELILGHQPCNLCLLSRIPYILATLIIVFSIFFKSFKKICFLILSIIFFLATLLAIYHVGIEQGIISESAICESRSGLGILDKDQLLIELKNSSISCKNVTFTILGFSLATINTFVSFIFSLITFNIFLKYEKKQ